MLRAFLILLSSAVFAEEPFNFDKTPGRLPKDVIPKHYAVRIDADVEKETFRGEVTIEVEVRKPVDAVVMNSLGLAISDAQVNGRTMAAKAEDTAQLLTLTGAKLDAGRHVISVRFSGRLSERQEGLYLTRYQLPDGAWRKALVTQMEATDARRVFPCWDEPAFRSTFSITAVVPAEHTVISNMPVERESVSGGRREAVFAKTPAMPSYLVALASAEMEFIEDEAAGVKLRVYCTPGKLAKARYAMDATKKLLPWFNDYFGVKYTLPKLDQVCFPSVAAGGMENWGCIIYMDTALLHDESTGSQSGKERVFNIVAHEIAHQWFGNLVTMGWWDNLWLNEGFASWMATKATDYFNPAWRVWLRAADGKEAAMHLDARKTTHPVQQPVVSEADAMNVFDVITYQKGQAFLRMLEQWLGEARFRDGMRLYFSRHANGNTTTADLWKALGEASREDVAAMAAGWTRQQGFPVVEVSEAGAGKAVLRQRRFTIHQREAEDLRWRIPVALRNADNEEPRVVMLGGDELSIEAGLPVVVNADAGGYFRTHYTGEAWEQLKLRLARLPETDRLAVAQDVWALVQAGREPFARWVEIATLLRNDPSPVIGGHIAGVIARLDFLTRGSDARQAVREWGRAMLAPRLKRLTWESRDGEEAAATIHRAAFIRTLGWLGDDAVVKEAQSRAGAFLEGTRELRGDTRSAVLSLAGRHATPEFWERLHARAKSTTDTDLKQQLYGALASTRDKTLAGRALATSLSGELPSKLAARMVGRVADEGGHPELAWKFAQKHLAELLSLLSANAANEYVAGIFRSFLDEARADELVEFSKANLPADAAYPTSLAEDEIRFNAKFRAMIEKSAARVLGGMGSGQ